VVPYCPSGFDPRLAENGFLRDRTQSAKDKLGQRTSSEHLAIKETPGCSVVYATNKLESLGTVKSVNDEC